MLWRSKEWRMSVGSGFSSERLGDKMEVNFSISLMGFRECCFCVVFERRALWTFMQFWQWNNVFSNQSQMCAQCSFSPFQDLSYCDFIIWVLSPAHSLARKIDRLVACSQAAICWLTSHCARQSTDFEKEFQVKVQKRNHFVLGASNLLVCNTCIVKHSFAISKINGDKINKSVKFPAS